MSIQAEIDRAKIFGEKVEELVVRKGQCPTGERETLLIGYWALIFDFHKGVLTLLVANHFGSAFALMRPVMEALFRSHLIIMGTEEEIRQIQLDQYRA